MYFCVFIFNLRTLRANGNVMASEIYKALPRKYEFDMATGFRAYIEVNVNRKYKFYVNEFEFGELKRGSALEVGSRPPPPPPSYLKAYVYSCVVV